MKVEPPGRWSFREKGNFCEGRTARSLELRRVDCVTAPNGTAKWRKVISHRGIARHFLAIQAHSRRNAKRLKSSHACSHLVCKMTIGIGSPIPLLQNRPCKSLQNGEAQPTAFHKMGPPTTKNSLTKWLWCKWTSHKTAVSTKW